MNIQTGEKLFQFASKQEWINKAQRIWKLHMVRAEETICVDQLGRICRIGMHFMAAERDNAYPIEVFVLRQDMNDVATARAEYAARQQATGGAS